MSEPQLWRLFLTNHAGHDLDALPTRDRRRVEAGLVALQDAYGVLDIRLDLRQVEGEENTFGLRVGVYRVIFRPDRRARVPTIIRVGPRRDAYRRR